MHKAKVNNNFFIVIAIVFITLCLSLINIQNISSSKLVLGTHSNMEKGEPDFWEEFLKSNPSYIPGLIEAGKVNQAKQIDPNFEGLN